MKKILILLNLNYLSYGCYKESDHKFTKRIQFLADCLTVSGVL